MLNELQNFHGSLKGISFILIVLSNKTVFTFVTLLCTIIFLKCTQKSFRDNYDEYYSSYFSSSTPSINSATKTVSKKNWGQNIIYVTPTTANLFLTTFNIHYEKPSRAFLWSSMRQHLKMFIVLDIQNVKKFLHYFSPLFTETWHALSICRQLCSIFHFLFL